MIKKKITVGINVATLTGWGGGIDFLSTIIQSLILYKKDFGIDIILLIPYGYVWENKFFRTIKKTIDTIKNPHHNKTYFLNETKNKITSLLQKISLHCSTIYFDPRTYEKTLKNNAIDLILPWGPSSSGQIPNHPFISYIFDFQHKYFPHFFSIQEYAEREKSFAHLLLHSKAMIVHSQNVKDDIERFYPRLPCKIFALPYAGTIDNTYFVDSTTQKKLIEPYNLTKTYFIICNQFWTHKNHITAIKALAMLPDKTIHLILTGKTEDYRYPNFFEKEIKNCIEQLNLSERIHILGHIPKKDQIAIMKNAIALIQPTLFEGAPGGGSASEALALGVPILISDIPVNKEINNERCLFFSAQSAEDLSQKMMIILQKPYPKIDPLELEKKSHTQLRMFGKVLLDAIEYTLCNNLTKE